MPTYWTIDSVIGINDLPAGWVIDPDQESLPLLTTSTIAKMINSYAQMVNDLEGISNQNFRKVKYSECMSPMKAIAGAVNSGLSVSDIKMQNVATYLIMQINPARTYLIQ